MRLSHGFKLALLIVLHEVEPWFHSQYRGRVETFNANIVSSSLLTVGVVTRRGAMVSKTSFLSNCHPMGRYYIIIEVVSDSSNNERKYFRDTKCMYVVWVNVATIIIQLILLLIRVLLCHVDIIMMATLLQYLI